VYTIPNLAKNGTTGFVLIQARSAHTFAITSYTPALTRKTTSQIDLRKEDEERKRKDVLVVGCRKKVVVYGVGRGGFKDGWVGIWGSDGWMQNSCQHVGLLPSPLASTYHLPIHPFFIYLVPLTKYCLPSLLSPIVCPPSHRSHVFSAIIHIRYQCRSCPSPAYSCLCVFFGICKCSRSGRHFDGRV